MTGFLPDNYKRPEPSGGNYAKLEDGQNRYRILSEAIVGWLYWTADNKPVRLKERPEALPAGLREGDKLKHMWAFVVWSYRESKVQILELTQASTQGPLEDLVLNADWGDPRDYDITITKTGQKLDTEYTVMPSPKKELATEVATAYGKTPVRLDALFSGEDPFAQKDVVQDGEVPFESKM